MRLSAKVSTQLCSLIFPQPCSRCGSSIEDHVRIDPCHRGLTIFVQGPKPEGLVVNSIVGEYVRCNGIVMKVYWRRRSESNRWLAPFQKATKPLRDRTKPNHLPNRLFAKVYAATGAQSRITCACLRVLCLTCLNSFQSRLLTFLLTLPTDSPDGTTPFKRREAHPKAR